jgi:hypothetical protein
LFEDIITGNGYKLIFEHIKGKDMMNEALPKYDDHDLIE